MIKEDFNTNLIPIGLDPDTERNIDLINNDSNLFGKFCEKLKILDDDSVLSKQFRSEMDIDEIKLKQKKDYIEKLLTQIFDYQKKIYNNENEIKQINNYRENVNKTFEKKLDYINKAYDNVRKTLMNNIKIKIN